MATMAAGPLSSIALLPSVWQCSMTSSLERPGMKPMRLRLLTCLTFAGKRQARFVPAAGLLSQHRTGRAVDVQAGDVAEDAVVWEVRAVGAVARVVEDAHGAGRAGGRKALEHRDDVVQIRTLVRLASRILDRRGS